MPDAALTVAASAPECNVSGSRALPATKNGEIDITPMSLMTASPQIHPVILSGGSGTRLWPLSRASLPKQFLSLNSSRTLIQEAVARVRGRAFFPPVIIGNVEHRFLFLEQLSEQGVRPYDIVLEVEGRNTAAAAAIAAILVAERHPSGLILLLPSDHVVRDVAAFHASVALATVAATRGQLVAFGTIPTAPATGFGYIRRGETLADAPGCFAVTAFKEKPDANSARSYMDGGDYLWNNGIFLFRADTFLAELEKFEPAIVAGCRGAVRDARIDLGCRLLQPDALRSCKNISIDYAVMERTSMAAVVPTDIGWNDVGTWEAFWELGASDPHGNVTAGNVLLEDVRSSYVRSEANLVAVLGVDNLVVVSTADSILVAHRDRVQEVKRLVERIPKGIGPARAAEKRIRRPWGNYESIDSGARFQVKRLVVIPGGQLSLQRHRHRAEHWVVVAGAARATCGETVSMLNENESIYIPQGTLHRLENAGTAPLVVIETQYGSYLGEDDIERVSDVYGRVPVDIASVRP